MEKERELDVKVNLLVLKVIIGTILFFGLVIGGLLLNQKLKANSLRDNGIRVVGTVNSGEVKETTQRGLRRRVFNSSRTNVTASIDVIFDYQGKSYLRSIEVPTDEFKNFFKGMKVEVLLDTTDIQNFALFEERPLTTKELEGLLSISYVDYYRILKDQSVFWQYNKEYHVWYNESLDSKISVGDNVLSYVVYSEVYNDFVKQIDNEEWEFVSEGGNHGKQDFENGVYITTKTKTYKRGENVIIINNKKEVEFRKGDGTTEFNLLLIKGDSES